jgi:signal transduction histidine kinase
MVVRVALYTRSVECPRPGATSVDSNDAVTAARTKQCAGSGVTLGICDGLVVGKHDGNITTTTKRRLERKGTLKLVKPDLFAGSGREKFHARPM